MSENSFVNARFFKTPAFGPMKLNSIMMKPSLLLPLATGVIVAFSGCSSESTSTAPAETSLKEAFAGDFYVGVALNPRQFVEQDPAVVARVAHHFNSVTAENSMKPERVQPEEGVFTWEAADAFVEFGEAHDMFIVGHTLIWHNQTADWMFEDENGDPVSREVLLERMRTHIQAVVGRYKGRVQAWDVVNEAIEGDGSYRESLFYQIIGPDYLDYAFRFAHEVDPDAALYYNDYSLADEPKREGTIRLLKGMIERGVPIHGVGMQQHIHIPFPDIEAIDRAISEFAALDLKVMVTELDIDVLPAAFDHQGADITLSAELSEELNPYPDGLPEEVAQRHAERYAEVFEVYLKHKDVLHRVTFWGLDDANTWLNNWPVRGRTNYPMLFDREGLPKPAFDAVIEVAREDG